MTQQDIATLTEIITSTQNQLSQQLTDFKSEIDQHFNKLEFRMDRFEGRLEQFENDTQANFERVNATLDSFVSRLHEDELERAALSAQVARVENWAVETAPAVGVEYAPGA